MDVSSSPPEGILEAMDAFEEAYKKLNTEQKRAVDTIDGPVMVVAGPGTGKTQMLTLRIANILKQTDTTPDSILALTFTESGVASMRSRLLHIMGGTAPYRVSIHTFHGFCNHLIEQYPEEFPEIIGSRALDDVGKILLVREALESAYVTMLRPLGNPLHHLRSISKGISDAKREYVSPEMLSKWALTELALLEKDPEAFHQKGKYEGQMKGAFADRKKKLEKHAELARVYERYETLRKEQRVYDFDDMIVETVRALETKSDFLLELQEEYQYLLADEHQDANRAQNRLLELLASYHDHPNIFVVGDPDQAIYRFQGASVENFLSFTKQYPDAEVITLRENYRSTQPILDAIAPLGGGDDAGEGAGALHAARTSGDVPAPVVMVAPDRMSELSALGRAITKDRERGEPLEEIAVLYRRNRDGGDIARALAKYGIPSRIESKSDALADPLIRDFISVIRTLAIYGDQGAFAEALHASFFALAPLDLYKFLNAGRREKISLYDLAASKKKLADAGVQAVPRFTEIAGLFSKWKKCERSMGLLEALEHIAHSSGFLRVLQDAPDHSEKLEEYRALWTAAEGLGALKASYAGLMERIHLIEEYGLGLGRSSGTIEPGRVRLMTAHRSKGLEFNRVYVVGATENVWEGSRSHDDFPGIWQAASASISEGGKESDERRLFYVALSRARSALTISYSELSDTGKPVLGSSFIETIGEGILSKKSVEAGAGDFLLLTPKPAEEARGDFRSTEKTYLNQLFLEQGLSVTALDNYLRDPWLYFYTNLIRIPAHPEIHQLFGTAVHAALDRLFRAYSNGKMPTEAEFIHLFKEELEKLDLPASALADADVRGVKALTGYYRAHLEDWKSKNPEAILSEYAISAALPLPFLSGDALPLRGKIDRLERLSDGTVSVTDYKTGKPKTRAHIEGKTKSSEGNYHRQIVFYKLLLELHGEKMAEGALDFVEPDEKGNYHREAYAITESEVEEMKALVEKVSREILDLSFFDLEPTEDNPYKDLVQGLKRDAGSA